MKTWTVVFIQMQWCLLISHHFQLFTSQLGGIHAHPNARFGWTSTKTPSSLSWSQRGTSPRDPTLLPVNPKIHQVQFSMVLAPKVQSPKFKIYRLPQITELSATKVKQNSQVGSKYYSKQSTKNQIACTSNWVSFDITVLYCRVRSDVFRRKLSVWICRSFYVRFMKFP